VPPQPRPGRHRAAASVAPPPKTRYAAVATTAVIGAGVVAFSTGSALPGMRAGHLPAADAATVNATTSVNLTTVAAGLDAVRLQAARDAAARASRAAARPATPVPAPPAWVRPVSGVESSPFGWRWGEFHSGVDLAAPYGTPIYAAGAGVVQRAGPAEGYGNLIVIRHADGSETWYGHEEAVLVTVGEKVAAGQLIARVGSLGWSTGPHLHFEVHVDGRPVDPVTWLAARGIRVS